MPFAAVCVCLLCYIYVVVFACLCLFDFVVAVSCLARPRFARSRLGATPYVLLRAVSFGFVCLSSFLPASFTLCCAFGVFWGKGGTVFVVKNMIVFVCLCVLLCLFMWLCVCFLPLLRYVFMFSFVLLCFVCLFCVCIYVVVV